MLIINLQCCRGMSFYAHAHTPKIGEYLFYQFLRTVRCAKILHVL